MQTGPITTHYALNLNPYVSPSSVEQTKKKMYAAHSVHLLSGLEKYLQTTILNIEDEAMW